MERQHPLAYFITFVTYGTWLHGDERGAIDRRSGDPSSNHIKPNVRLRVREQSRMAFDPVSLGDMQRDLCTRQIAEVCSFRRWGLLASNVRTNHVHVVVAANATPEKVMGDLKAWCTRRLREAGLSSPEAKVWADHGSTLYLWSPANVEAACNYVLFGQGGRLGTGDALRWNGEMTAR